jgi:hypothetical protein
MDQQRASFHVPLCVRHADLENPCIHYELVASTQRTHLPFAHPKMDRATRRRQHGSGCCSPTYTIGTLRRVMLCAACCKCNLQCCMPEFRFGVSGLSYSTPQCHSWYSIMCCTPMCQVACLMSYHSVSLRQNRSLRNTSMLCRMSYAVRYAACHMSNAVSHVWLCSNT